MKQKEIHLTKKSLKLIFNLSSIIYEERSQLNYNEVEDLIFNKVNTYHDADLIVIECPERVYIYNPRKFLFKTMNFVKGELTFHDNFTVEVAGKYIIPWWNKFYTDEVIPNHIMSIAKDSWFTDYKVLITAKRNFEKSKIIAENKIAVDSIMAKSKYQNIIKDILRYKKEFNLKDYYNEDYKSNDITPNDTITKIYKYGEESGTINIDINKIQKMYIGYYEHEFIVTSDLLEMYKFLLQRKNITALRCGVSLWEDYWWKEEYFCNKIKIDPTNETYECSYNYEYLGDLNSTIKEFKSLNVDTDSIFVANKILIYHKLNKEGK